MRSRSLSVIDMGRIIFWPAPDLCSLAHLGINSAFSSRLLAPAQAEESLRDRRRDSGMVEVDVCLLTRI